MCALSPSTALPTAAPAPGLVSQGVDRLHVVLLGFGALALFAGLCGSLWRLGWTLPHGSALAAIHGPLMISGVFGTLISLESAVAIGRDGPTPPRSSRASARLSWSPAHRWNSGLALTLPQRGTGRGIAVVHDPAAEPSHRCPPVRRAGMARRECALARRRRRSDAAGWWLTFLIVTIAGDA
jgi:hypothetical protein